MCNKNICEQYDAMYCEFCPWKDTERCKRTLACPCFNERKQFCPYMDEEKMYCNYEEKGID